MHKKTMVFLYVLSLVLHACGASMLPTLEAAETVAPTVTEQAKASVTPPPPTAVRLETVVVTGNVNVRDYEDQVYGWMAKGEQVAADCSGNWCVIAGGQFDGLQFWRGCSSDNPENLGCQTKGSE